MEPTLDYEYENYSYIDSNESNVVDFNNCTSLFAGAHIFLPTTYYLIFFAGFWGNLFVISVVGSKEKRSGRLVDTFVVNLAVADLIFVVTLPLWAISASQNNTWNFGDWGRWLCKLSSYIISVNRFSNIFFLTCMSIDRYLAIVKMMDSRYLRRSRCINITCSALWMVSLVLGLPSLVYRDLHLNDTQQTTCVENNSSTFLLVTNTIMVFLTFVFPVFIITLCYGTIIKHLNKHCSVAGNPRADDRRRHSLKMVLCIIFAFVLSWLPYNIFKSMILISHFTNTTPSCETQYRQNNGLIISCCLAFFNSCINPAIYFFLDHHFRKRVRMLCDHCQGKTKLSHSFNSSLSFTNTRTSEILGASGRMMSLTPQ